jgi:hypothetical protein
MGQCWVSRFSFVLSGLSNEAAAHPDKSKLFVPFINAIIDINIINKLYFTDTVRAHSTVALRGKTPRAISRGFQNKTAAETHSCAEYGQQY